VVQKEELDDLSVRRSFRTVPGSIEGKHFWTTREDAERFVRLLASRWGIGPSWIVEVKVESGLLDRLAPVTADGRSARVVDETDLDWFNGVVMALVVPTPDPEGPSDD
jgi:hypothetical protein